MRAVFNELKWFVGLLNFGIQGLNFMGQIKNKNFYHVMNKNEYHLFKLQKYYLEVNAILKNGIVKIF